MPFPDGQVQVVGGRLDTMHEELPPYRLGPWLLLRRRSVAKRCLNRRTKKLLNAGRSSWSSTIGIFAASILTGLALGFTADGVR